MRASVLREGELLIVVRMHTNILQVNDDNVKQLVHAMQQDCISRTVQGDQENYEDVAFYAHASRTPRRNLEQHTAVQGPGM